MTDNTNGYRPPDHAFVEINVRVGTFVSRRVMTKSQLDGSSDPSSRLDTAASNAIDNCVEAQLHYEQQEKRATYEGQDHHNPKGTR